MESVEFSILQKEKDGIITDLFHQSHDINQYIIHDYIIDPFRA